jgi:hypothetical protein
MTAQSTSSKETEPAKKPYETPRLEIYGDIREVTDTAGHAGHLDGGAHGSTKTG